MRCPRCDAEVAEDRTECPRCGVVFAKAGRHSVPAPRRVANVVLPAASLPTPPAEPARPPGSPGRLRLSPGERVVLMEALARGLGAGLPVVEMLRVLDDGGARTGRAARALAEAIEGGATLAAAWRGVIERPGLAAPLLLEAAEATGDLERACRAIARLHAQVADVLARLRSSLVRPLLVVVAACLLLPVPTLVLGSGVAYALEVGGSLGALAALAVALVAGARWLLASPERAERLLDLPFGRDVDRWTLTTVLEGTLRAGTPPAEVLERLREASVTPARRARFEAARGVLSRGGTFTDAVSLLGVFDATARLQVRAGEESGTLDDVFDGLARTAGEQLERRLALASKLVTFAVSMLTLALIGLRVLAAYQGVLGGEQKLLDEIEAEMPIRALDGLKLR